FGISADKLDEYKGVDVAGKVVIVLRDAPEFLGRERQKYGALVEKMKQAEKRDALAVLFVNDAALAKDGDDLLDFNFLAASRSDAKIPACHVKRAVIDKMLTDAGLKNLAKLEAAILDQQSSQSAAIKGWTASLDVRVKRDGIELKNVIGVL